MGIKSLTQTVKKYSPEAIEHDNLYKLSGKKVAVIGSGQVSLDKTSTNTAGATTQIVKFLGPTVAYTSPAATKSILIGGTFSNLTGNNVNITPT